jgi:hypothetical protein
MRIDPAPSAAIAAGTMPAATAAAEPPLDPPGVRSTSHGLRVTPHRTDSVNGHSPSSGIVVLPTTTAPAARSRRTTSASSAARAVKASVPRLVTSPARSISSLTAIGTPSNGASSPAALRRSARSASSRARAAYTAPNAFKSESSTAILANAKSTSSREDTSPRPSSVN